MFSIVIWVVFGYIAGNLAMWLLPPKQPVSGWQTIAVGVGGSVVGGMAHAIVYGGGYSPAGLVWSVLGAVAVVAAWRWYQES